MSVIWGIPYLLIRVAVRHLDPGVLVLGRTGPAALLLLPLVFWRGQVNVLIKNLPWIAVFGVVEFGVPWFLMATAEKHITSSLTSLLICAVPLFSVVAQKIRRTDEHISARRYAGLLVGAIGVALLVGLDLKGGSITWIGIMMVVGVGYSIGPIILATKLTHVPGPVVVAGATSFVAICWIPWSVLHWPTHLSSETLSCVAVLSIVCTAGAFLSPRHRRIDLRHEHPPRDRLLRGRTERRLELDRQRVATSRPGRARVGPRDRFRPARGGSPQPREPARRRPH
jgi:drug/metabolite transporter (DMT)-like permease